MRRRGPKEVEPGLARLSIGQEGVKVPAHLIEDLFACRFHSAPRGHHRGRFLREIIRCAPRLFIRVLLPTERRVRGCPWAPYFVALADVVTGVAQEQRKAGDRRIPDRAIEDRSAAGVEKEAPREHRTAA